MSLNEELYALKQKLEAHDLQSWEDVTSFKVGVDGDDSTEKIISSVRRSRFRQQIRLIAINGIALGGLNIINAAEVSDALGMPIVAITRKKPHREMLAKAILNRGKGVSKKMQALEESHRRMRTIRNGGYYLQLLEIEKKAALGRFDEMIGFLRLAHIIGRGISSGESRGRI